MTTCARDCATGFTRQELMAIEHAAVHAWPASETRDIGGWLWRYSGGNSQRANSVSPLAFRGADVEAAIGEAEELYFARNAPSRFQVGADLAAPGDLDRRLERRGYRLHEPVTTLAKRIGGAAAPREVGVADRPGDGWMDVYLANITADRRAAAPGILASVPPPRAFLRLESGGRVVATALAVLCGEIVVAECIGTRAEARRSGAARIVMAALEAWGTERGATVAALQAVTSNVPAQRLYAGLGYTMVNDYHYRVRDC
ncbi:MAG: GNAT family N-acetyltransferase [Hyphomicrobiaceae bacterium]|nr:GNAT family N-acetyltransferase [Hyphomicrobiaceae bacterium]